MKNYCLTAINVEAYIEDGASWSLVAFLANYEKFFTLLAVLQNIESSSKNSNTHYKLYISLINCKRFIS